jgi:excisionase family DNA binding protein
VTLAELRELAERLPPGGGLMLPRETLLELCGAVVLQVGDDFTVAQLAERLRRKPSTVRGWCERGELPGAYKLNRRDWRIPLAAVEAFLSGQRPSADGGQRRCGPSLSDWRHASRPAGIGTP